ncbi:Fc receptor-like protein 2 [Toxorhynchites rutilus septentrionalis]|uniref:Fc receptor-like protein 2 n=1 Tax=Toxorhynchites rutilus septentrionalis TaxID=329112 RepID=UPI002478C819|nr:Fc receptor-like protein 2 [Toxorhynchites rutilus septentrionalis]
MWLEKLVLVYLLTLFNSLDGYFLDNNLQNTGRHRRKESNEAKSSHRNALSSPHHESQFITKNNSRVVSQRGGLAVLPCSVTMSTPATVSWFRRKDYQLLTVGLSTYSSDDRFLVEHTRHLGNWALRIKNARKEDEGLYECQISTHPPQSIFIELRIVEAAAEILEAPDLHIDEGSTLRLECKLKRATESPLYVFWYHEDRMVNYDQEDGISVSTNKLTSSILTVRNATARHGGNYTCAPANARQSSVYVHVLKGEKPAAMQHPNKSPTAASGASSDGSGAAVLMSTRLTSAASCWMTTLLLIWTYYWSSPWGTHGSSSSSSSCSVAFLLEVLRRKSSDVRLASCRTTILCILLLLLVLVTMSTTATFSKRIKLIDAV